MCEGRVKMGELLQLRAHAQTPFSGVVDAPLTVEKHAMIRTNSSV